MINLEYLPSLFFLNFFCVCVFIHICVITCCVLKKDLFIPTECKMIIINWLLVNLVKDMASLSITISTPQTGEYGVSLLLTLWQIRGGSAQ